MKESNRTPGPWVARKVAPHDRVDYDHDGVMIPIAAVYSRGAPELTENALLIAAAPDLLAALERMAFTFAATPDSMRTEHFNSILGQANVAIEKARGIAV